MTDTTETPMPPTANGIASVGAGASTDLPSPPKILVRSMSVATGADVMGYTDATTNGYANNTNGTTNDTNEINAHDANDGTADAPSPAQSSPSAASDSSVVSYDSSPSVTALEIALSEAPGVTTDRSDFLSTTSTDDSATVAATPTDASDTATPAQQPPRSLPVLERSYTASELLTRRQKEIQSARGANDKPAFATATTATTATSSSSASTLAPSFEIESVVLPSDAISEIEIDKAMHTLFAVEVRLHGGLQWIIKKRYSDFRELHDRLKRTNASVKSLHFPKRHVFRNRHQSVIEQRRSELEKYINDALEIRPLIRVPLFNFLEVYVHMESYERKVQRHKKELESERMKNLLEPTLLEDLSSAFQRLCSSKFLYHGNATGTNTNTNTNTATTTTTTSTTTTTTTTTTTATTIANGGETSGRSASTSSASANGGASSVPTSPKKDTTTTASTNTTTSTSPTKKTPVVNGAAVAAIPQTAGAQIYLSRTSFRRDVLGVFPDMPSSFAMRFMKAVSDRQGADINMDEFLRAIAVLERGTLDDKLRFVFHMCDLDHAGKVQSTGLSNFLVSLHGRHVLDLPEYRRVFTDAFDHGRVRMSIDEFVAIMPRLEKVVDELLLGWMAPFVDVLCETPDPQLLESQEEFNPVVQQKILATDTRFSVKEVSMLQDAFNNYRASGGGDAVDLDALTSDFPLEMTDERFQRVFASFGPRANGLDIDIFSFVHALAIACRGSLQEKAGFAFKLFATAGKDGSLMTRDDLYGMMRLDLSQNPALERLVTAFMERYKKKHLANHASAKTLNLKATDSTLSESGAHTPSVSGSQLGRFVDTLMAEYGHENTDSVRSLTLDEFVAWTTREKYEMASLRIMREVVFVDLGLVPGSKDEELAIVKGCFKSFDPASLVEDEAWFLMEKKWFDHWCKYIGLTVADSLVASNSSTSLSDLSSKTASSSSSSSKSSAPSAAAAAATAKADAALLDADGNYTRPKPINNYPILTNDRREHILKSSDEIKLGKHYAIVPEQLWMGLKVWYGGGPEIRRKVVIKPDGSTILDIWEEVLQKKKKKNGSDDDDDEPDLTSEEEKNKRTKALALPRRMRTGGSVGLTNLGNTCYMNSALQCLTNTQLLAEYFLSGMYLDDVNRTSTLGLQGKLAEVYGKLAEDMWCAKQKALSPRNFKKTIGKFNEAFRGSDQQDAQELLAFLLSGLSEDLNRIHDKPYVEQPDSDGRFDSDLADEWWRNHLRREVSIIVALFTGQYKSLLTCSECGFKSARFEPFTFLQLPLPEPTHNTVTLALVLSNGMAPMKVSVRLGISATIFDLKHELMKLCHTDFELPTITEADIKVCEYTGSMILSFKADSRRIGQIRSIERLIAFQLEPLAPETIEATRNRRPSYVPASSAALRIEEIESERHAQATFFDNLTKGTLVEVKPRSQSHEYIPGVIVECPSIAEENEAADDENGTAQMPLYRIRLQRVDEEMKVPATRLRPRQARLLYIPLLSRKLSYSALYFKNPFRPAPFGIPNLVRICPELTSGFDLYKLVWQRVKRYVESSPPHKWQPNEAPEDVTVSNRIDTIFTGLTSSCGFVLRRVESKGLTDSRSGWLTRSFGQIIPCTDEPISIMEEETIAIDWDLEIFQDRDNLEKMKHIESHASVEKNEAIDKGPVPLRHCLDAFTSEEKISEGYCSSCRSHQEMTKKLEIWRLPPVMVVHLKRFQYTQTYRRKLASLVEFPVHGLDLNSCVAPHVDQPERYAVKRKEGEPIEKKDEFSVNVTVEEEASSSSDGGSGGDKTEDDKTKDDDGNSKEAKDTVTFDLESVKTRAASKSSGSATGGGLGPTITRVRRGYTNTNLDQSRCLETKYDLYGVVNHQGALGGGHYTAHAKNFLDDQWYYYDDERVRVVEESKVVSPSAYLLFYVRSDMQGTLVKDLYPPNSNKKITDEDINRFVEDDRRCSIM